MSLFRHRRAANRTPEYRTRQSQIMRAMWEARKKQGKPYFPRIGESQEAYEERIAEAARERHEASPSD